MRTESEMSDLILGFAREDDRIRAVYMNGSRTNPNARRDLFQDYDIVYTVTATRPFLEDRAWLANFGEVAVMQEPDLGAVFGDVSDHDIRYAFLMQFEDGNRIDLTLQVTDETARTYQTDSLTVPLLDKDGLLPEIPAASDRDYLITKPDAFRFAGCCNEFWWVSPYVAKGLWRGETLYAMEHFDRYVRDMLLLMLTWEAGVRTDFTVSAGKCGKYLQPLLPQETWSRLMTTYALPADENAIWDALFAMGDLFRDTARFVADALGLVYNEDEDRRTTALLRDIRALRKDAVTLR